MGFLFIMLYSMFGTPYVTSYPEAMKTVPPVLLDIYFVFHSFVTVLVVGIIIWMLKPKLLPALSGWVIHILLDLPFHESTTFATRFVYPFSSDAYFTGVSWLNIEILAFNYLAICVMYIYVLKRELRKHHAGENWQPDWIDRIDAWGQALLREKIIPSSYARRKYIRRASRQIYLKNKKRTGQGEDSST